MIEDGIAVMSGFLDAGGSGRSAASCRTLEWNSKYPKKPEFLVWWTLRSAIFLHHRNRQWQRAWRNGGTQICSPPTHLNWAHFCDGQGSKLGCHFVPRLPRVENSQT